VGAASERASDTLPGWMGSNLCHHHSVWYLEPLVVRGPGGERKILMGQIGHENGTGVYGLEANGEYRKLGEVGEGGMGIQPGEVGQVVGKWVEG